MGKINKVRFLWLVTVIIIIVLILYFSVADINHGHGLVMRVDKEFKLFTSLLI